MKKQFAIAFAVISLAACNTSETESTTIDRTDANETMTDNTAGAYTPADGDVTYRDNQVRVWRNDKWEDANEDVTLDNGVVVNRNGRVVRDGKERELRDGEIVNRTGDFFDRSGRAIENAWDATKEGVKDAGRAIENAAEKVGDGKDNNRQ